MLDELFVLEAAQNHQGDLARGLEIIETFGALARKHNIRASLKLQFRDVESYVHKDFRERTDIRYVKRIMESRMSRDDYAALVTATRRHNLIPSCTPFDQKSVDMCIALGVEILKVASSSITDWVLLEKIASAGLPVISSVGGSSLKDVDDLVHFFTRRRIPFALNACSSIYPSEDEDLDLNQLDFLRDRYPGVVIGFSSHEYGDPAPSMLIAYAKGARTFERHIDLDDTAQAYNLKPLQCEAWFMAWHKARAMCGAPGTAKRIPPAREREYLDKLVRGVYAKRDLLAGTSITDDDIYLAVPLQPGQICCRQFVSGMVIKKDVAKDGPL